jgi:hypothetical protein
MERYRIDAKLADHDFKLPLSYLDLIAQDELPDLDPWWFLAKEEDSAIFWAQTLRKLYPGRSLLPFAKIDHTDDVACFDLSDTSGNPKVFYVHAFASPGWEYRGEVPSFDAWLENAKEESEEFKAES